MNILKKTLLVLLILVGLFSLGFVIWGSTPAKAMPEALAALNSDEDVNIQTGRWLVFSPASQSITAGFIFYPGGRVDYRAYAPYARSLAENGILVVIPKMPLNLAVFGIDEADQVMAAYPQVTRWLIGGHSLGGSMAASYLYNHPDDLDGLVLLASYPAENNDLTKYQGGVLSISASLDGLATPDKIDASRALLPASTQWVVIEGGNHAYFGWYGPQKGDNPALITREEQQQTMLNATLDFIASSVPQIRKNHIFDSFSGTNKDYELDLDSYSYQKLMRDRIKRIMVGRRSIELLRVSTHRGFKKWACLLKFTDDEPRRVRTTKQARINKTGTS